jgi:hypothetical protein
LTKADERLWVGGGDGYRRWQRQRKRRVFEERKKMTMKEKEVRTEGGWIKEETYEEREKRMIKREKFQ